MLIFLYLPFYTYLSILTFPLLTFLFVAFAKNFFFNILLKTNGYYLCYFIAVTYLL